MSASAAEPVRQSERTALYDAAVAALRAAHGTDAVYECFCSRKDIVEATSAPHPRPDDGAPASGGAVPLRPPGFYPGTCRGLSFWQLTSQRLLLFATPTPPPPHQPPLFF